MKNNLLLLLSIFFSAANAQEMYLAVLSKGMASTSQNYTIKEYFPIDKIDEYQAAGFYIDDISYGGERWTIVASDKKWITEQRAIVSTNFPESEINNMANEGFFISSLSYGKDYGERRWGIVFAKGLAIEEQIILEGIDFPHEEVQNKLIEGYRITEICAGNEEYKIVMVRTEDLNFVSQDYLVTDATDALNNYLKTKTGGEYPSYITHLSYQNNLWFVVTTFGTKFNSQYFTIQKPVPDNTIKGGWDEGYVVSAFQKMNINRESSTGYMPEYLIESQYSGKIGCPEVITPKAYNKIASAFAATTITGVEGDNRKIEIVRDRLLTLNACFSVEQVARMINNLEYDESRFSLIEVLYHHIYDVDNVPALQNAFQGNEELLAKFKELIE